MIRKWQVQWFGPDSRTDGAPPAEGAWIDTGSDKPLTSVPKGKTGMWVRFTVPAGDNWRHPGILAERLYGHKLSVYQGKEQLFESDRDFVFDLNKLVTPVKPFTGRTEFYIRIGTLSERAGLISGIRVGEYEDLSERFVRKDLPDMMLGSSVFFLGVIMLICSGFLKRGQRGTWISLCLIAMTTGILIIVNSPLPYIYFKAYGPLFLVLLDISLFTLFPALSYYIDRVFEQKFVFFNRFRRIQIGYSAFCFLLLAANLATHDRFFRIYYWFTVIILGLLIMAQLVQIVALAVIHAVKGNKDAIILSAGIGFQALTGVADLTLFYVHKTEYELFLWKFGVLGVIASLIVVLARQISADHAKLVVYSKELELFNHKLQRTEKMKIISDLAASVAHEVRNPLQVTRGFLQLLSERIDERNKPHFAMAIDELDRASGIITDFLTFAKPELEEMKAMNVSEEIRQIEAMMSPLATMKGGKLLVEVPQGLHINGNPSKFKQALMNMIKNSIEAIDGGGRVEISARPEQEKAVICIKDNGEGMEEEELAKLGDPYFSTKKKGTGLGLMVTFRIIEVMSGTIEFRSRKGKGTEAIIQFPIVHKQAELPGGTDI
ncbi:sensor histidine kinase [Paenibacillus humicola]|uniref:sensor histidine kinase n=1 Tax=Paenibacillus humicola TaxID=3110540 RepID=UPI00237A33DC|nr:sensor histidine kinase [Paenibacillus humicola]